MVFISAGFAIFFFVTLAAYYLLPGSTQWVVLLIASMVFYLLAGTPFTIIYLLVSAVSVYYAARYIGQRVDNGNAHLSPCKLVYVLTVCLNVGMLSSLKYMNFLTGNLNNVLELFGCPFFIPPVHWIASLGISYYTLQVVGYLTDVYWGIAPAQRNLCKMALFAGFFPQMVSGPISRYGFLESTLYARHDFDYGKVCMGLQRMLWGVLKKMVIADHLFPFTEMVFNDSGNYSGVFVWIGTLLYVLQIYADFSGCMDIALGASECFGITLPENFREPFASVTIQEFWQRWHITLGLWLRDYIMYPILRSKLWTRLGKRMRVRLGKRLGKQIPTFLAMLVLWILMGVWHGNGWKYVVEGFWFWLVIVCGQLLEPAFKLIRKDLHLHEENKVWTGFRRLRTLLVYSVGALFFKAQSTTEAFSMIRGSLSPSSIRTSVTVLISMIPTMQSEHDLIRLFVFNCFSVFLGFFIFWAVSRRKAKGAEIRREVASCPIVLRWALWIGLIVMIIIFGAYGPGYNASDFIYGGF